MPLANRRPPSSAGAATYLSSCPSSSASHYSLCKRPSSSVLPSPPFEQPQQQPMAHHLTALPAPRLRSNSCICLSHLAEGETSQNALRDGQRFLMPQEGCLRDTALNSSNSALDQLAKPTQQQQQTAKDPVVESSLAIRKLSQAFGRSIVGELAA
ncbi:hypothetical protein niasHT_019778 [Heterodera trifolii]|uniref:Uncharacterized protein n=1 Tax=Heterodera trifolii TaxID=157864 RepID=A0ABD2LCB6_9BILA